MDQREVTAWKSREAKGQETVLAGSWSALHATLIGHGARDKILEREEGQGRQVSELGKETGRKKAS